MSEWITVREAADIGVHMFRVPKMIRRGELTKRAKRPVLDRADVIALRAAREAAAAEAPTARRKSPAPPDDEHIGLSAPEAGADSGVGPDAVRVRGRRGRLPSVLHDGRRWFRRDHLELVRRADR